MLPTSVFSPEILPISADADASVSYLYLSIQPISVVVTWLSCDTVDGSEIPNNHQLDL